MSLFRKSETYTLILILVFLGLLIGTHWKYGVSFDAIVQTIGSMFGVLIGSFLSGKYAISVMQKQIKNEKITREIESIGEFMRFWNVFKGYMNVVITSLEQVSRLFNKETLAYDEIQLIKMHCTMNRETLIQIRSLPHEKIPLEMHNSYMVILSRAELINSLFNSALTSISKDSKEELLKENDEHLNGLFDQINLFREFVLEQEEKLKGLNK